MNVAINQVQDSPELNKLLVKFGNDAINELLEERNLNETELSGIHKFVRKLLAKI
jgi:hypothetical protein